MKIEPETKAAIKLTRADAVKLVAADMMTLCVDDVAQCQEKVHDAKSIFHTHMVQKARSEFAGTLGHLAEVTRVMAKLHGTCTYCVYTAEDSGDTAEVIFSDHQKTYEARIRFATTVELSPMAMSLRDKWSNAIERLRDAIDRDTRVGAMKKEARELLIKSALDSSDEGIAVVAAIRALSKSLKDKS